MDNNILVSVVVITYNSAKFVLETLESIKNQTYLNIELIISDDCSIDSTLKIADNWVKENKNRFVRTKIISTINNTGVSRNFNRGIIESEGTWLKIIAGDDILLPDCISDNLAFLANNQATDIITSKMISFKYDANGQYNDLEYPFFENQYFFNLTPENQYKSLLTNNFVAAPTCFIAKRLLEEVGYADESYPSIEDHPLWLKITKHGVQIKYMDTPTVLYRLGSSVTRTPGKWVNEKFHDSKKNFYFKEIERNLSPKDLLFKWSNKLYYFKIDLFIKYFHNNRNFISININRLFNLIDPLFYKSILSKIL